MFETDNLIYHLINDTKSGIVHWSRIGDWGEGPCSTDFCSINPVLYKLTCDDAFSYDYWSDMLIANVMTGFVYLQKQPNVPPRYSIYLQTDCHAKIVRLNVSSKDLQPLYETASEQLIINRSEIMEFLDSYHNSHCVDESSDPEND